MILLQKKQKLVCPNIGHMQKNLEKEKPKLSLIDFFHLSKISPKFIESSFHSKNKVIEV